MNFAAIIRNIIPNKIFNTIGENLPFKMAPIFEPTRVPKHRGIAYFSSTNPWLTLRAELKKALMVKQAKDEPMAIFTGTLRKKIKIGTKSAPVPIPKKPGKFGQHLYC